MKIEKYPLKAESSFTVFEFISEGPKGLIRKIIQFQETNQLNVYNLAFGDKNSETGEVDDLVVSDNGDSEKVLATVVAAVYAFFDKYPEARYSPPAAQAQGQGFTEWALLNFTKK